ncbi:MAG: dipeptide epimerase [Candidatus Eremiobacteraeota bacterium]|nr:dipeptide epimerase [Candidatus Eremiobacteraeota bacterium]
MSALTLSLGSMELPLVHPFTISRSSESVSHTAIFRLQYNGMEGLGEAAPSERYNESVDSILSYVQTHNLRTDDPYMMDALLDGLPAAVRCGLDCALHDLIGKDLQVPLYRLLGVDPAQTKITSFTIGISEPELTQKKLAEIGEHPIIKVKLGKGREIETVEAIRSKYTGTIRVDANEGWTAESSVVILRELERFDIEFCEQPIPAGHPEQLRFVRERSKIPIVTDEDSKNASDLPALFGCVDGVNVKLVKCGGIRGALAMIATARALGLKIMLGCMVETGILSTAAAHLTPLVDWADIDGPFLTANHPFQGVAYRNGKLILPNGPGLGVHECAVI